MKQIALKQDLTRSFDKNDDWYLVEYSDDHCLVIESVLIRTPGGVKVDFAEVPILKDCGGLLRAVTEALKPFPRDLSAGEISINFGTKYRGRKIKDIDEEEFRRYLAFMRSNGTIFHEPMDKLEGYLNRYWGK